MTQLVQLLQFALPAVIVIATLEGLVLAVVMRRSYNWRAWLASLVDALGRQYFVYTVLPLSLAQPLVDFAWSHRLFTVPLNSALAVVVLVLAQDFSYYWFHRCSHRVRWFWATHAIHHSSNEFNLATSYRFGWTGRITGVAVFYVPMIWLGFAPGPVFVAAGLGLLYQFWLHAEWIPKLGWLEYVLNTPSHHRVHHAANPEYLDRNYGGIFIVFDRLFGTFVAERDDVRCRYGLVTPLRSNNPVVIAFHEWAALGRDLWRARSWRERLACLIGPPAGGPAAPSVAISTAHELTFPLEIVWRTAVTRTLPSNPTSVYRCEPALAVDRLRSRARLSHVISNWLAGLRAKATRRASSMAAPSCSTRRPWR